MSSIEAPSGQFDSNEWENSHLLILFLVNRVIQLQVKCSRLHKQLPCSKEEEGMEPRELQRMNYPREQGLLLENLRSNQNAAFEELARRALEKQSHVDVDFVYPQPWNKSLLDIACCDGRDDFVEILLNNGANPNKINDAHNRAPIHFAAEAGHASVIATLLKDPSTNPDLEVGQQTALHIAVRNDHKECIQVLLENGANPNIVNSKGVTPIHVAATMGRRETVQLFLKVSKLAPDIDNFRDFRKLTTRDVLQQKMPDLELPSPTIRKMNDPDDLRRSCLNTHSETTFLENLKSIDDLRLNEIDELMQTSARRNFPKAMRELMRRGLTLEDGSSTFGKAARIAVELGHHDVLREMLMIDSKLGNELLLTACQELGVSTVSMRRNRTDDRMKCLRMIMEQPDVNVRCEDDKGNTPLHYAARAESVEAVNMLLRAGSYIGHRNVLGVPPLAHMSPGALSEFFDDCLRSENERTDEFEIEFDYTCLMPHNIYRSRERDEAHEEFQIPEIMKNSDKNVATSEMETLAYIASNRSLKPLLKHPLISSFLYLKWHRIRHILYANFVFYVIFYALINSYVLSMNYSNNTNDSLISSNLRISSSVSTSWYELHGLRGIATIALIFLAIRESLQFFSSPRHYVSSFENMLEVILLVLGAWVLVSPNPQVGAVVILLSAWELVILIGQHPRMSTGIEMFKTVSKNFVRFLFLYAFLILAFALAFFTLFKDSKDDENFPDPGHSLFKTIIMLTGEFDANDIPFVAHPVLSHCIFVLFVFLIAIVLFNLLNGLAVSDTADILNKSELVGLISRAKLVAYAESVAVASGIMKLTGCCCSEHSVRRSKLNPLGFLGRRILLFSDYLPQGKIGVKPYKYNTIRLYGRVKKARNCTQLSMDPWIVERAREVLSKRGVITENERMLSQLEMMNHKLERLETVIDAMRQTLENNNVNSNGED